MEKLNSKWQKLILWLTGYLNIIAFVLGGGFVYLKTQDEKVKKSAKTVLAFVIVFTIIDIIRLIIANFINLGDNYEAINGVYHVGLVIAVIKAVTFVTFCVLDMFNLQVIPVDKLFKDKTDNDDITEEDDD